MEHPNPELSTVDDAALVARTRDGDPAAYAELWRRYAGSARAAAVAYTRSFDPDDLAAEAFTRVFRQIVAGGGPTTAFRAYLIRTVQNVAVSWSRGKQAESLENIEDFADPEAGETAAARSVDRHLVARAYATLPERWQRALWLAEVEGRKPREIGPALGLAPNSVSALVYRAREGLRQAWVQAHVQSGPLTGEHRWTVDRMGSYTRGKLPPGELSRIESHLSECAACTRVEEEARSVASVLPWALLPLVAGAVGSSVFLGSSTNDAAMAAGVAAPAATQRRTGVRGLRHRLDGGSGATWLAAGAAVVGVLAVSAGAAFALALSSAGGLGGSATPAAPAALPTASLPAAPTSSAPAASPPAVVLPEADTDAPAPVVRPSVEHPAPDAPVETSGAIPHGRPSAPPGGTPSPSPTATSTPVPSASPVAPAPPRIVRVDTGNGDEQGPWFPVVFGTAEPGATVSIVIGGGAPVEVTASTEGEWTTGQLPGYPSGTHALTATQRLPDGAVSAPASSDLTIAEPPLLFVRSSERGFSLVAIGHSPGSISIRIDGIVDGGSHDLLESPFGTYLWIGDVEWHPPAGTHDVSVQYRDGDRFGPIRTVPLVFGAQERSE